MRFFVEFSSPVRLNKLVRDEKDKALPTGPSDSVTQVTDAPPGEGILSR